VSEASISRWFETRDNENSIERWTALGAAAISSAFAVSFRVISKWAIGCFSFNLAMKRKGTRLSIARRVGSSIAPYLVAVALLAGTREFPVESAA